MKTWFKIQKEMENESGYPLIGNPWFYRYKFGGGSPDIPAVRPTPPAPRPVGPEVTKARQDIKERARRTFGRAASNVTRGGSLGIGDVRRPVLSDVLG